MKKTRKFVDIVKMRKMLKGQKAIVGITSIGGKDYQYISDGYRIYADLVENFDERLQKQILEIFGQKLEKDKALIKEDGKVENFNNNLKYQLLKAMESKIKKIEFTGVEEVNGGKYVAILKDKISFFNKNYFEAVRLDDYTVIAGKGGIFDPIVIYKPMQTDFYWLLPISEGDDKPLTKELQQKGVIKDKGKGLATVNKDIKIVDKDKKQELKGFTYLFSKAYNIADLKRLYKRAIKIYHPDRGGNIEDAQALGQAYQDRYSQLKNQANSTDKKDYREDPQEFIKIFNLLMGLDNLNIDIVGGWLWISGDTKKHKDILKNNKLRFSGSKKMWYWFSGIDKAKRKASSKKSYKDIKDTYGAVSFKSGQGVRVGA